jgi:uncharacterized protein (TIGR02266 family)
MQQARKDRRRSSRSGNPANERRGGGDRRSSDRIAVEMWVEESTDRELYFQRSANLSEGGIFLENTVPHPLGTIVNLQFTLPGDSDAIRCQGEIVNPAEGKQLGMGIKFVSLDSKVRQRLQQFIAKHARKADR